VTCIKGLAAFALPWDSQTNAFMFLACQRVPRPISVVWLVKAAKLQCIFLSLDVVRCEMYCGFKLSPQHFVPFTLITLPNCSFEQIFVLFIRHYVGAEFFDTPFAEISRSCVSMAVVRCRLSLPTKARASLLNELQRWREKAENCCSFKY
jgi:hypothetical protein